MFHIKVVAFELTINGSRTWVKGWRERLFQEAGFDQQELIFW